MLTIINLSAQNFEWMRGDGNILPQENVRVCAEPDGHSVYLLRHHTGWNNFNDSITLDSFKLKFPFNPGSPIANIVYSSLFRLNSLGQVTKVKLLASIDVVDMCRDDSGNFYMGARIIDLDSVLIGNQLVYRKNGNIIFLKYNRDFQLQWYYQTGNNLSRPIRIMMRSGKILFISSIQGNTQLGNEIYNNIKAYVFGQLDTADGEIMWSNYFFNNQNNILFSLSDVCVLNNRLFFVGKSAALVNNFGVVINGDTFSKGGFVIKADSAGNYIRQISVKCHDLNRGIETVETDGKYLFIGGIFSDSIIWAWKIRKTGFKDTFREHFFMASVDEDLNHRWFYAPEVAFPDSAIHQGSGYILCAKYHNQFIYYAAWLLNKVIINGITYRKGYNLSNLIMKFDLLGNVNWAVEAGYNTGTNSIDAVLEKGVYMCGGFYDELQFGPFKDTAKGWDAFAVKLSDNAIIRGAVSSGPYCAGDTIRIPYKKIGDYDTSNYFIAELSDENGDFNGAHRELGRVKTNKDSVVLGLLPLFQVSSSEKYRIRIMSTAPAVQSYYKVDTLRLLIYSRDKADPGRDTTICKGDSLQLRTFGGTRWTWSPKYKMKDSSARETMVWPDVITTYKIIIADSSGCGIADTALKTVYVRDELSLRILTPPDTTLCIGGSIPLIASFHGGDSTGYSFQWAAVDALGNYSFPKSGSGQQGDTLIYTMPVGEKDSMRFILYLSDGCSPKTAFATYTLKVSKTPAQGVFTPADTALCPGTGMPTLINFTGAPANKLSWVWQENNSFNQWIQRRTGNGKQSDTWLYTLPLNWKGIKKLRVILSDACSGLKDTAIMNITPRDTLRLSLNTVDTTLCRGQSHTWKASGQDGYTGGYQFVWTDLMTGDTLSKTDSLRLLATNNKSIKVTLADGCMPKSISRTFSVTVHPILASDILFANRKANDTVLCYGQQISYSASASGGKGSGYTYKWLLGGTEISTSNNLQLNESHYKLIAGSKTRLQLMTSDGCTLPNDSSEIELDILSPLSQAVQAPDSICHGSPFLFKTNAAGGNGNFTYIWKDAAGTILSNKDTFTFTHTGNQTGSITHRSIVSDGCSINDTITVHSELLAPLSLSLSASDPCPVNALTLSANANGGKTSAHKIQWFDNGVLIGSGSSLNINTGGLPKTYTAILSDGCSMPPDTQSISSGARPGIKILATGVCLGELTSLLARSTNAAKANTFQWQIDGSLQTGTDSILKKSFTSAATYKIKVIALSSGACNGSDSVNLEIISKPKAAFDFVHFNAQVPIPFKFNNRSLNSQTWVWDFGSGDTAMRRDPLYYFNDTGRFKIVLIASNQGKCFDTAMQIIPVYPSITFYFPNVFSPNGNSINESFGLHPGQWFMVSEYNLKIFNRWGEMLFNSDHMEEHWDGYKVQQSVYIWKAEIRDVYGVLHELEGVVEVLR